MWPIKFRSDAAAGRRVGGSGDMDLDEDTPSGFDTRHMTNATDFEMPITGMREKCWTEGIDGLCVSR